MARKKKVVEPTIDKINETYKPAYELVKTKRRLSGYILTTKGWMPNPSKN
jgi:hypothetical protein